jgi:hypothetical protein
MLLQTPSSFRASFVTAYLNGFRIDPARGLLTVPRVFLHDDVDPSRLTIVPEAFREHHAASVASEIEEVLEDVGGTLDRLKAGGRPYPRLLAGAWDLSRYLDGLLTMQGPAGRLVEVQAEAAAFALRVGHSSEQVPGRDRQARFLLSVSRPEAEPRVECAYDFGFGPATFPGLLRFLGVELTTGRLEWMNRDRLWKPIRKLLESDGYRFPAHRACRGDQYGLAWQGESPDGDPVRGYLWTDDEYPLLRLVFQGLAALPPSFLPLWSETQAAVREAEAHRRSSGAVLRRSAAAWEL